MIKTAMLMTIGVIWMWMCMMLRTMMMMTTTWMMTTFHVDEEEDDDRAGDSNDSDNSRNNSQFFSEGDDDNDDANDYCDGNEDITKVWDISDHAHHILNVMCMMLVVMLY
jgi:hypothetical protein